MADRRGSLPLWEKPDSGSIDQLTGNARAMRDAIMLVGKPKSGHGTAFVISRKHRLLATNAHVADIFHSAGSMIAIRNDTLENYKVAEVWYHPGVYRMLGNQIPVPR